MTNTLLCSVSSYVRIQSRLQILYILWFIPICGVISLRIKLLWFAGLHAGIARFLYRRHLLALAKYIRS